MSYLQYKLFMQRADKSFVLFAAGHPGIHCHLSMSYVTDPSANVRDLEVTIPPKEFATMSPGVPYALRPGSAETAYHWRVKDGLTLTREQNHRPP